MRHTFGTSESAIEFPGGVIEMGMEKEDVRMVFLEMFGKGFSFATDSIEPSVAAFTLSAGTPAFTRIDVGIDASDNDGVQSMILLVSDTQTTAPTSAEIKAVGVSLGGSTQAYAVTGLEPDTTYYGWLLVRDASGNESAVTASTPASLATAADTAAPTLDAFSLSGTTWSTVDVTLSFTDLVA